MLEDRIDTGGGARMASEQDQSGDVIQRQVKRKIARQLFYLLPVPTIAKVCDMTDAQVLALVGQSGSEGAVTGEQSDRKPPRTIKLLDHPVSRTTIPKAYSTKRIFQRHQEVQR